MLDVAHLCLRVAADVDDAAGSHRARRVEACGRRARSRRVEAQHVDALASLGGVEAQLLGHVNCCMNTGVTPPQMEDLARTLKAEVGEAEGAAAEQALKEALAARK